MVDQDYNALLPTCLKPSSLILTKLSFQLTMCMTTSCSHLLKCFRILLVKRRQCEYEWQQIADHSWPCRNFTTNTNDIRYQWRHYACTNGAPHRGPWAEGAHPSSKVVHSLYHIIRNNMKYLLISQRWTRGRIKSSWIFVWFVFTWALLDSFCLHHVWWRQEENSSCQRCWEAKEEGADGK